jgi:hypothetical protein
MLDLPTQAQSVNIMFKPEGDTSYQLLETVPITSPQGYFDTRVPFPSNGTVQLSWTYPADSLFQTPSRTVYSRTVGVSIH